MEDFNPKPAFMRHLKRYKAENDLTNDQVAELLGWKPSSFQKAVYNKKRSISPELRMAAVHLFKCPVSDLFIDDPSAIIPDGLGPVDQYRFDQIITKLSGPDLTAQDRQILFEDFMAAYNRLKTLKAGMVGGK